MEKKGIILVVGAALFFGLMAGILLPSFFGPEGPPLPMPSLVGEPEPPFNRGPDYSLKIREIKRQLQKKPDEVSLLIQLGNTYFDDNRYPEAIEAYSRALALSPGNPDVLTDLGIMHRRNGDPEKASECFRQAASLSPDHPQCRLNLGIVLFFDLKDPEGAIRALEDFIRIVGDSPEGHSARTLIAQIRAGSGKE